MPDGPAGRRLAVKDLFDTAGVLSTYGSAVFAEHVPSTSAAWVVELESRGWVNVGKANLHELAFGGAGTGPRLAIEVFAQRTGIKVVQIVYKGGGPAMIEFLAGQTQIYFSNMVTAMPHVKTTTKACGM